ncbi:MAG TPA: PadR family transcriptional regulator [Anaerolineales bacterium]|nr:PadR family transcriptional regulator [Anaerolineales bacterium]
MLRYALLGLLAHQPHHGYELKTGLEQALGGNWEINFGQIYTTLSRLERDGLVTGTAEAEDGRGKRTYSLTPSGKADLDASLEQAVEKPRPLHDEFFIKLVIRHLAGYDDAHLALARQRQAYLQQLRELNLASASQQEDPLVSLLVEGAILHLQADLQWLGMCEERLEALSK